MWILLPVVVLIVLAIAGGLLVSGIYAIVLLPIAAVVVVFGAASVWRRAHDPEFRDKLDDRARQPLGGSRGTMEDPSTAPTTPDELLDARRRI
jgi:hypothetical protein